MAYMPIRISYMPPFWATTHRLRTIGLKLFIESALKRFYQLLAFTVMTI
jgi:hypothetical protein